MEHITTNDFKIERPTAVVLGNFDGVHLGHKSLIDKAIDKKSELIPTVLSFYPHPVHVLNKNSDIKLITSRKEKAFLIKKLGTEIYIEYPFDDKFAVLSAEEFVENILFTQINCKKIIVGENYRFGKGRQGDTALLKRLAPKYNATVVVVPILSKENNAISSTLIRQYISSGYDIKAATKRLTYPYMTMGKVTGVYKSQYSALCFKPCPLKLLPKDGVYITKTFAGHMYDSITAIAPASPASKEPKVIKTYLSGFSGEAVGKDIIIYYFDYIGEESAISSEQYEKYMRLSESNIYSFIFDSY